MPRNPYSEKKANYPEFKQGMPEFKTGWNLYEYGNTAEQSGFGGDGGILNGYINSFLTSSKTFNQSYFPGDSGAKINVSGSNYFQFDGTTRLDLGQYHIGTSDFYVEFWFKGTISGQICGDHVSSPATMGLNVNISSTNFRSVLYVSGTPYVAQLGTATINWNDGNWHKATITGVRNGNMTLRIDDKTNSVSIAAASAANITTTATFKIANNVFGFGTFGMAGFKSTLSGVTKEIPFMEGGISTSTAEVVSGTMLAFNGNLGWNYSSLLPPFSYIYGCTCFEEPSNYNKMYYPLKTDGTEIKKRNLFAENTYYFIGRTEKNSYKIFGYNPCVYKLSTDAALIAADTEERFYTSGTPKTLTFAQLWDALNIDYAFGKKESYTISNLLFYSETLTESEIAKNISALNKLNENTIPEIFLTGDSMNTYQNLIGNNVLPNKYIKVRNFGGQYTFNIYDDYLTDNGTNKIPKDSKTKYPSETFWNGYNTLVSPGLLGAYKALHLQEKPNTLVWWASNNNPVNFSVSPGHPDYGTMHWSILRDVDNAFTLYPDCKKYIFIYHAARNAGLTRTKYEEHYAIFKAHVESKGGISINPLDVYERCYNALFANNINTPELQYINSNNSALSYDELAPNGYLRYVNGNYFYWNSHVQKTNADGSPILNELEARWVKLNESNPAATEIIDSVSYKVFNPYLNSNYFNGVWTLDTANYSPSSFRQDIIHNNIFGRYLIFSTIVIL